MERRRLMGLFDKKYCDICGKEIKLLGGRKIENGNICKDCNAKLSHWFTGRKKTSLEDIKEQLAYREENERKLKNFDPDKIIGDSYKFYIDQKQGAFVVSTLNTKWKESNPDIIRFSDVRDMKITVKEDSDEIYDKNEEGKSVRFDPPRYEYKYDFNVHIDVKNPFFDTMDFKLNNEKPRDPDDAKYRELADVSEQILSVICGKHFNDDRSTFENPQSGTGTYLSEDGVWYCPDCGTRNEGNFCVKCGKERPMSFEPFYCSKCGAKIEDPDIIFCPKCGNKLK